MEQLSLKTTQKLAERPLYNHDFKKDPQRIGEEVKGSNQVGTCAQGEDSEEKGDYAAFSAKPWAHEDHAGILPHGDTT